MGVKLNDLKPGYIVYINYENVAHRYIIIDARDEWDIIASRLPIRDGGGDIIDIFGSTESSVIDTDSFEIEDILSIAYTDGPTDVIINGEPFTFTKATKDVVGISIQYEFYYMASISVSNVTFLIIEDIFDPGNYRIVHNYTLLQPRGMNSFEKNEIVMYTRNSQTEEYKTYQPVTILEVDDDDEEMSYLLKFSNDELPETAWISKYQIEKMHSTFFNQKNFPDVITKYHKFYVTIGEEHTYESIEAEILQLNPGSNLVQVSLKTNRSDAKDKIWIHKSTIDCEIVSDTTDKPKSSAEVKVMDLADSELPFPVKVSTPDKMDNIRNSIMSKFK